ncbi:hypothetical protein [Mycobacterium colombiense]|nr:hypothetical protein [Mycobacterium colombiense]
MVRKNAVSFALGRSNGVLASGDFTFIGLDLDVLASMVDGCRD